MSNVQCPITLKRRYAEGRVIPFVGAGASMSIEWTESGVRKRGPSWSELVDQAAKELGFSDPELLRVRGNDLQILEYFKIKHHGRTEPLVSWLTTSLNPPDAALLASPIHKSLVALDLCRMFYTTNYDAFLESAFRLHGRNVTVVASEPEMANVRTETEIVKFHGDLLHMDRMVLSEKDYQRRLKLDDEMDFRLRSDALGRVLLFIGYSFRDYNVSYLFQLVVEKFGAFPGVQNNPRAYITIADPSQFEYELFGSRKIDVIAIDGENATADTAALLDAMRGGA